MRSWLTILFLVALLVVGGILLTQQQSGEPFSLTKGYVPRLDATQALYFAGATVVIVASVIGLGVTLAVAMNFGSQQVASVQALSAKTAAAPAARETKHAADKAEGGKLIEPATLGRGLGLAGTILALAMVAFLTINRAINPPKEGGAETPAGESTPAVAPAPAASGPADLQSVFAALPAGDAAKGKDEFAAQPCASCHSLEPNKRIVGPSLAGVAARAASRKPGYSAELYLYESITKPSAYVVQDFQDGLMPQNFAQTLTPQQQADLIAFLMTQK
ncbi:MAG: c-type cytochrome [Chloroflexi bacterium]|nr:c-type cytochrome [Chloroflexota bacterium]